MLVTAKLLLDYCCLITFGKPAGHIEVGPREFDVHGRGQSGSGERLPQGRLMCTLGGNLREKQKIREKEEEEEIEEEEEEEEEAEEDTKQEREAREQRNKCKIPWPCLCLYHSHHMRRMFRIMRPQHQQRTRRQWGANGRQMGDKWETNGR